jgi:hypothetical protein
LKKPSTDVAYFLSWCYLSVIKAIKQRTAAAAGVKRIARCTGKKIQAKRYRPFVKGKLKNVRIRKRLFELRASPHLACEA